MRSRTASKTLVWRTALWVLPLAGLVACYSMDPPAAAPRSDPLADPPPGAASGDPPPMPVPSSLAHAAANPTPEDEGPKKNKFDEGQAKVVLARAAGNAHSCVEVVGKDQPHGEGTVLVKFSGTGKSTEASIAAPFDNTPIGQCATRAFVGMIVPPFEGPDVEMTYQVNLNPDPKGGKKEAPAKGAKKK
jgi:hypothetical protein